MGFIHEVKSEIFGIEERSESVYLRDDSEDGKHMFFHHERPGVVQLNIHQSLMVRAGKAYEAGDEAEAKRLKRCAEDVASVELTEPRVSSVEVTKTWLRDLYEFIADHETVLDG